MRLSRFLPRHFSPPSTLFTSASWEKSFPFLRPFSSLPKTPTSEIAQSIADQLIKPPPHDSPLSLQQRLSLHFSRVCFDPPLILQTLNLSADAGRTVLSLHRYLSEDRPDVKLDDSFLRHFVEHLGRSKDFKAVHEFLVENRGIAGPECFKAAVDRIVRAGRPTQTIAFFERMEKDYGFVRDRESLVVVVTALCEHGFASHAERFVKQVADKIFPDESICDSLVRGWCLNGKYDEARRLVGEITRGGFELGTSAYNALLDCLCKLCRKKDPFRLMSEAEKVLIEMETVGVPRDVGTFNVLINNLCKIRKTEEALNLFDRMGEWGCSPNAETYTLLIRSLYQAARISEGDEMIDRMKSAGFGESLDKKAYYGFIKILCGIEQINHALDVFVKMKKDQCKPGIKTYDLLMRKLCAHGKVKHANFLFSEAGRRGLSVTPKPYKIDPRFVKKPKDKEQKPKRETLPMKMERKRRRLRKLRLSYVKKPRRGMRMG
ncbi:hypothetical protein ACLOJK_002505 [Asimina triloba]